MTAPQQTNREWLKMMAGQRAIRDHERFASCAAEIEQLVAALKMTQFGFNHRRCNVCAGWNVGPNGETDNVHTAECPIGLALAAVERRT